MRLLVIDGFFVGLTLNGMFQAHNDGKLCELLVEDVQISGVGVHKWDLGICPSKLELLEDVVQSCSLPPPLTSMLIEGPAAFL